MMAALTAAKNQEEVVVFEHNALPGKKLLSTGNGRCNFTNTSIKTENYYGNTLALERIRAFDPQKTIGFFNALGVVEHYREGLVYPVTDQAASVQRALHRAMECLGVSLLLDTPVEGVEKRKHFHVLAGGREYVFHRLIVATGLRAAPKLGSDGSFLSKLKKLGVYYRTYSPALCPLLSKDPFFAQTAGVRARGSVEVLIQGERYADLGEIQFTKEGLSGIPVFQISRHISRSLQNQKKERVMLDIFAHLGDAREILYKRRELSFMETFGDLGNGLIPSKLWQAVLQRCGLQPEDPIEIRQLNRLTALVKNLEFTLDGVGSFHQAQVCTGGIPLEDLDETMMYRRMPGLYFAGEIVDVDGMCGGYNLQWAWSSGALAGRGRYASN